MSLLQSIDIYYIDIASKTVKLHVSWNIMCFVFSKY